MNNFWKSLKKPFTVLAPMEGVTDNVFREIVNTYLPRPDVFFTEFTNSNALATEGYEDAIRRLSFTAAQKPIVAQIWGINPEHIYKATQIVEKLGFDGVDVNMGCPDKEVMRKGSGAAHIGNFSLAKEIIAALKEGRKNIPVSIKTRLGKKEIEPNWIPFLLEQDLDALTIHARTASQKSVGSANWEEIGKAVELKNKISPNTVIIGNGDIRSYKEIIDMYEKYQMDGAMVGRGIFTNPTLFRKDTVNKKLNKKESFNILLKHVELFDTNFGKSKNFNILKKYFKIYIKGFPGSNELRKKLMDTTNIDEVRTLFHNL